MSWDYIIEVDHVDSTFIERLKQGLVRIMNTMFLSPLFAETFKLTVYEATLFTLTRTNTGIEHHDNIKDEISRLEPGASSIGIATIGDFIIKHANERAYVQIRSGVLQMVRESVRVQHPDGTSYLSPYNATGPIYKSGSPLWIGLQGKEFRDGGDRTPPVGKNRLYFDFGNARYYNGCTHGESARISMSFLLQYLSVILNENIIGMRGLNADHSLKPNDFSLRYVRYPHVLIQDLMIQSLIQDPHLPIYEETILLAVEEARDIKLYQAPVGFIIYHKDGTGGSLQAFYQQLAHLMS